MVLSKIIYCAITKTSTDLKSEFSPSKILIYKTGYKRKSNVFKSNVLTVNIES